MIRHTKTKAGAIAASAMLTVLFAAPLAAAAGTPHPNGGPTPAATTTTITGMASTFVAGDPISVNVSVAADPPGGGTPTGTVTVSDGGSQTCPVTLAGGTGSCSITEATPGPFSFTATYSGDANFASSGTAAGFEVTVGGESSTTTITGTTTGPVVGQPITVNFGVTGSGTPTGTVTVSDGGTQTCSATLVGGAGSCSITETAAGAYSFTATYSGDTNFASSVTSTGSPVTVGQAATTTGITSPTPSPVVGQPITSTSPSGPTRRAGGTPTGTRDGQRRRRADCEVALLDGAGSLPDHRDGHRTVQLHGHLQRGQELRSLVQLDAARRDGRRGRHDDGHHEHDAQSGRRPAHHGRRQRRGQRAGSGTPTGTVTVSDGGTQSCPVTLVRRRRQLPDHRDGGGPYSFTATYAGDGNDSSARSRSAVVTVTVAKDATNDQHHEPDVPIRSSASPSRSTSPSGPTSPGSGTPTGTVTVSDGTRSCLARLSGGTGSCHITETAVGRYIFTASYGGTRTFASSVTSSGFAVTVGGDSDHDAHHGHDAESGGRPAHHGERQRRGERTGQRHAGWQGDGERRRHQELSRHLGGGAG